jgi:simple sugar transport system permease protein
MSVGITKEGQGFDIREFVVKYGFIVVTVSLFLWFALTEPSFRMQSTLFSMLKFTSVVAITGLGVTLTMVVGGLDLSVGSVAGLSVTLSAMTMVIYCRFKNSRLISNIGNHVHNYGIKTCSS